MDYIHFSLYRLILLFSTEKKKTWTLNIQNKIIVVALVLQSVFFLLLFSYSFSFHIYSPRKKRSKINLLLVLRCVVDACLVFFIHFAFISSFQFLCHPFNVNPLHVQCKNCTHVHCIQYVSVHEHSGREKQQQQQEQQQQQQQQLYSNNNNKIIDNKVYISLWHNASLFAFDIY